ncbi:MAG: MFS transporter [Polyangiaceae bacterium]|nr:MFS transporter [Polyangiaceae bacterium]
MYQASPIARVLGALVGRRGERGAVVGRNVVLLGLTSLVTDVSAEMVSTILPLYLLYSLEVSPLGLGAIDGLYHAVEAIVRVSSAYLADRLGRMKALAAIGYALSAVCKLGLLLAGSGVSAIAGVVAVDRMGKGVRAAPRDALVSLSVPRRALGAAFGVHRALDTTGAMLGPLVAFGLLAVVPGGYDVVFVVSFCVALLGLAIFLLLVESPAPRAEEKEAEGPADNVERASSPARPSGIASLAVVGAVFGAGAVSDGLFYLVLQKWAGFEPRFVPLVFVASALSFAALAIPMGRLADHVGRRRVFVAGHVLLAGAYAIVLAAQPSTALIVGCVLLVGAFYAATDGVLIAVVSAGMTEERRTTGIASLTTAVSLARFVGSLGFGAVWAAWDFRHALSVQIAVLGIGVAASVMVWRPRA